jgi:Flp pilus assembly protein TadB
VARLAFIERKPETLSSKFSVLKGNVLRDFLFLILFFIFLIVWLICWLVVHITVGAIHILIVLAIVFFIIHLIRRRRTSL